VKVVLQKFKVGLLAVNPFVHDVVHVVHFNWLRLCVSTAVITATKGPVVYAPGDT
jgi:hypothetical protein